MQQNSGQGQSDSWCAIVPHLGRCLWHPDMLPHLLMTQSRCFACRYPADGRRPARTNISQRWSIQVGTLQKLYSWQTLLVTLEVQMRNKAMADFRVRCIKLLANPQQNSNSSLQYVRCTILLANPQQNSNSSLQYVFWYQIAGLHSVMPTQVFLNLPSPCRHYKQDSPFCSY